MIRHLALLLSLCAFPSPAPQEPADQAPSEFPDPTAPDVIVLQALQERPTSSAAQAEPSGPPPLPAVTLRGLVLPAGGTPAACVEVAGLLHHVCEGSRVDAAGLALVVQSLGAEGLTLAVIGDEGRQVTVR